MSTTTTNYSLIKPATTDVVDIAQLNTNADTIDTNLNRLDSNLIARLQDNAIIYVAHRCNTSLAPEESFEAAAAAEAMGAHMLDFDANLLADGAVGILHDSTVDRTTTSSGAPSTFTALQWGNLAVDAGTWFAPAWSNTLRAPLCSEILDRFGGKIALSIEAKTTSVLAPLINEIVKRRLQRDVLINTSIVTDIAAIKAAGIHANYWFPTAGSVGADLAAAVAAAPNSVQVPYQASDADIQAVVAAFPSHTYGYTLERRYLADHMIALGCKGLYCDDQPYVARTNTLRTTDSWATNSYGHGQIGHLGNTTYGTRGTFSSGELILDHAGSVHHMVIGEVSPIASLTTFTIDMDVKLITAPADLTRFFILQVNLTDQQYIGTAMEAGYNCFLRANGQMGLYRNAAGSSTSIATKTSGVSAWAEGDTHHYRLAVTPTAITFTDTTTGFSVTGTDTTYRNVGYVHVGKSSSDGSWSVKNLAIT